MATSGPDLLQPIPDWHKILYGMPKHFYERDSKKIYKSSCSWREHSEQSKMNILSS